MPSPRAYPSADASKVLQRPSGARNRPLDIATMGPGADSSAEPATTASSDSPRSRLVQARCRATSDPEHAVSIERLGPRKSNACEIRFDSIVWVPPVAVCVSTNSTFSVASCWSMLSIMNPPTNTPTLLPAHVRMSAPASSKPSKQTSSRFLCCGSRYSASRREIPKNFASNPSIDPRYPAREAKCFPAANWSGSKCRRRSLRAAGISEVQSRPASRASQNCSGPAISPGRRQPMPMIAILTCM